MHRIIGLVLRLSAAFLTFKIGVTLYYVIWGYGMGCSVPIERARLLWQEDIAESVFRYEIEHFTPGVDRSAYYLSGPNDSDPSAATMSDLKADKLPVKRLSELGLSSNAGCFCEEGEAEFILRVGGVRWINDNEALVGGSLHRWRGSVDQAFLFNVARKGRYWVVHDHELL